VGLRSTHTPFSPAPAFFHFPPFYHLSPKLAARFKMLPHFAEGEVPVGVCPPEGGAPKCVSSSIFPNLRRMHEYWNTPFPLTTLFLFPRFFLVSLKKRNISPGTWEHIKLGVLPGHNAPGFFCWGRSLKIHIEIKKGVVSALTKLQEHIFFMPMCARVKQPITKHP